MTAAVEHKGLAIGAEPARTSETQRLDKWLWYARIAKSRTLAANLIASGKVRVNREKISKPAQTIRTDDVVTVTVARRVRVVRMRAAGVRRGPAPEAQMLYDDLTPAPTVANSSERPTKGQLQSRGAPGLVSAREPGMGRPTKRDRRLIERFKSRMDDAT